MSNSNVSQYDPGAELSNSLDFSKLIGGPLGAIVDAQTQAAESTVDYIKSVGFGPDVEDSTGAVTPGEPVYVSFKYPKQVSPYQPAEYATVDTVTVETGGATFNVGDRLEIPGLIIEVTSVTGGVIDSGGISYAVSDPAELEAGDHFAAGPGSTADASFKVKLNNDGKPWVPAQYQDMEISVPLLTLVPIPFIRVEEGFVDFNAKITSVETKNTNTQFKIGGEFSYSNSVKKKKKSSSINLKVNASYQKNTSQGSNVKKTYHMGVKVKVVQDEMPEGMEKLLGILEEAMIAKPL